MMQNSERQAGNHSKSVVGREGKKKKKGLHIDVHVPGLGGVNYFQMTTRPISPSVNFSGGSSQRQSRY